MTTVLDTLQDWAIAELKEPVEHKVIYYDKYQGKYLTPDGAAIPEATLLKNSEATAKNAYYKMEQATNKFFSGSIDLNKWQQSIAQTLKDSSIVQLQLGKGGKYNTSFSDYGKVGAILKQQYAGLSGLAEGIQNGKYSMAQIQQYVKLYADSLQSSYGIGKTSAMAQAGYDVERRVLNPAEHCDDCIGYADLGWVSIGSLPEPGMGSVCRANCKCSKEYGKSNEIAETAGETPTQSFEQMTVEGDFKLPKDNTPNSKMESKLSKFIHNIGSESVSSGEMKNNIISALSEKTGIPYQYVNDFIKQWAYTSNDTSYAAMEAQRVVAQKFGIELSNWQQEQLNIVMKSRADSIAYGVTEKRNLSLFEAIKPNGEIGLVKDLPAGIQTSEQAVRVLLDAMYDNTQDLLADALGSQKTVVLYRGISGFSQDELVLFRDAMKSGTSIQFSGNAMESWSWDYFIAKSFSNYEGGGIVVKAEIPIERIVGSARSGFGCMSEGEFVVLGNTHTDSVLVSYVTEVY